jgi:hypothetical protein
MTPSGGTLADNRLITLPAAPDRKTSTAVRPKSGANRQTPSGDNPVKWCKANVDTRSTAIQGTSANAIERTRTGSVGFDAAQRLVIKINPNSDQPTTSRRAIRAHGSSRLPKGCEGAVSPTPTCLHSVGARAGEGASGGERPPLGQGG